MESLGSSNNNVDNDNMHAVCVGLNEDSCQAEPDCIVVVGNSLDDNVHYLGCTGEGDCGEARRPLERVSDGECFLLEGGCLPVGYEVADTESVCARAFETPIGCAGRQIDTCVASDGCSPVFGEVVDDGCFREAYAGCMDARNCSNLVLHFEGPSGGCWRFPSLCVPTKWTPEIEPVSDTHCAAVFEAVGACP